MELYWWGKITINRVHFILNYIISLNQSREGGGARKRLALSSFIFSYTTAEMTLHNVQLLDGATT